jgi:hypothetical protein
MVRKTDNFTLLVESVQNMGLVAQILETSLVQNL